MSLSAAAQNGSDALLAEIVEEFTNRVQAGEPVDVESYAQKHPEHAARLRQLLPALALLNDLGRSASAVADDNASASGEGSLAGVVGDFRIVREVGKGGMGVVYEAEQISLRRRVALKVLPFAATMDARHLQRFHNEAQAAACLHHTNIVTVFSVGCERGVHFYAMQFIDGQPLSEIIRQLRRAEKKVPTAGDEVTTAYPLPPVEAAPTPLPAGEMTPLTGEGRRGRDYYRKVAELGIQAAEALDHAHQLGIVHRDIKPANLMLDVRGNLWVTDFGLAHIQHGEASLTGTGQMVGTPRYMSPEQSLAKRVPIDHRTDIYSLGVTLYELLTLRPVFTSEDRQELLRQIAFEEPSKPRRLERAIPAELETIVLKAMEKRPQDRYATAQELADDLRHWLDDRPIRARRPSWVQVGRKWARRHQSAVRAMSALLLVLLVIGIVNAFWWVRKQTAAETEARAAFDEALRWQRQERWSEALSAIHRAQVVLRGFGADGAFQRQVDQRGKDLEMAEWLEEARLQNSAIRDEFFDVEAGIAAYQEAFAWYGLDVEHGDVGVAAEFLRSRSISKQLVAALDHWASLLQGPGRNQERSHLLDLARSADSETWRNRLRDAAERGDGKACDDLLASAKIENLLPTTLSLLKLFSRQQQKISGQRTAALLRRAQQRQPSDFWINRDLADLLHHLQPPQLEEAIGYYRAAVALRPLSPGVHFELALALYDKGRLDEAIDECPEAIRLKRDYTQPFTLIGLSLSHKGRLDEAIAAFREVIHLKKDSFEAHNGIGAILCNEKGDYDGAVAEFREAIRLKKDFAQAHHNLGCALWHKGLQDEAIAEFRKAICLEKEYVPTHYGLGYAFRYSKDYVPPHYDLGNALSYMGRLDEAIAEYREAIRIKKDCAEAHCNLGHVLEQKGRFAEALVYRRRGHELGSKNPRWPYPSPQWVRNCERLVELDGKLQAILSGQKQPADDAERLGLARLCRMPCKKLYAAAFRFYNEAFADKLQLADDLNAQHRYNAACAAALAGCGQGADADKVDAKERARLRQQARDWLRADLKTYRQVLEKSAGKAGPAIAQQMQHWLQDGDFAGVREADALTRLLNAERRDWQQLWRDVDTLRLRAHSAASPDSKKSTPTKESPTIKP